MNANTLGDRYGQRERSEGMFDLSKETNAALETDGWELIAVVSHIGVQTEYVFEREAGT